MAEAPYAPRIDAVTWSCVACGAGWPASHRFCAHCGTPRAAGGAATGGASGDVADVLRSLVSDQLTSRLLDEGGRLPGQRRLVTALFADLSGFTPLAGRLDPEDLAAVVDPLLEGLVRVVARHEGYVGSFAGDALLAFFGAPTAHEDDAERALRTATDMLAEFPALLAAAGPQAGSLSLRIGVDTGSVLARLVSGDVRTDYSILGNAVNMAQRLQSNAPPGGCWVGEATFRLAGESFDLQSRGLITVKGRAEPMPAYELVGTRLRSVARRRQRVRSLVGRSVELAAVTEALGATGARGLLLRGEAGVGKSRLVEAARELTDVARWVEGGCAAHDAETTYRPWLPVAFGLGDPSALAPDGTLTPAARRRAVAAAMGALLTAAAPVVVALEDLHWADRPSLDLLEDLLHELGDADVLLLGTSRSSVRTTASLPTVDVAPLSESAVGALVQELLEGSPPVELVADVSRRSGGNPLFAAELARALLDRGLVRRAEGGVLVAGGAGLAGAVDLVPDTLEGLVGARIDALPSSQARVLTIAAVLGPPVRTQLLAAVADHAGFPGSVAADVSGLAAAGLLVEHDFVHAVVQDTVYARTPRRRRRELHLAAAEVGPGLVPDEDLAGYLARHLYLGAAGSRAVTALQTAAERAASRSALEEAVLHLTREVELRRLDPAQRVALPDRLALLGEHLEVLGRYEEAEPVVREATALGAGARADRALAGCLRRLGRYEEALQAADPQAAGRDEDLRGLLLEERGWSLAATGRADEALALLADEHLAGPAVHARLRLLEAYSLTASGDFNKAERAADDAYALLASVGDLPAAARALRLSGDAKCEAGRQREARDALERGRALAQQVGSWEEVAACTSGLATLLSGLGDCEGAVREGTAAQQLADRMGHVFGRVLTRANLAYYLLEAGRLEESIELATEAAGRAEAAGLPALHGTALGTLAEALESAGRLDAARERAEEAAGLLDVSGHSAAAATERERALRLS